MAAMASALSHAVVGFSTGIGSAMARNAEEKAAMGIHMKSVHATPNAAQVIIP